MASDVSPAPTPRTARQILGQVLGRHHRQLVVSGTNCTACHDYHPTSTDLINAMEAAAIAAGEAEGGTAQPLDVAQSVLRVIEHLIEWHGCRDSDMGVPCAWHAGELERARAEVGTASEHPEAPSE